MLLDGSHFSLVFFQAHEFDDCRFDVGINDCLWYLRASSSEERQKWISMMELHKVCVCFHVNIYIGTVGVILIDEQCYTNVSYYKMFLTFFC